MDDNILGVPPPPAVADHRRSETPDYSPGLWQGLIGDPDHGPIPALLMVMTATTGIVDAVSILSLGRVFVANMTGNVVFVGFALAGAKGFSLAASLFALGGFLLGALGDGSSNGFGRAEHCCCAIVWALSSSCWCSH